MTHTRRWVIAAAAFAALLAVTSLALWVLVPDDDELARRVEAEFEARLGQKLVVGAVHWRLFGLPRVEVLDAHTVQPEAIRVRRIAMYPALMPLLRQELVINRLEVDGAVLPRNALAAFRGKAQDEMDSVVLRAVEFTDATYIAFNGIPVVYEGAVEFDGDQLPQRVEVRRPDAKQPTSLVATREGKSDNGAEQYELRVEGGGGSARGQARLATAADGRMVLTGELAPRGIEVQSLLDAFHRRSPVSGVASGQTALRADGDTVQALIRSLHTRSVLTVVRAKILRFNMEAAVKSAGQERAGETPLDSLSTVVDTQNTEQGMKAVFTNVKAAAGTYTATGQATLYRMQIDAQGRLEVGGGLVEVPFSVQGPTQQPSFSVAWEVLAGAAIGTAVLPGIGTVLGAKIGGVVGGPPKPPPPDRVRR
ncbi:MAG: hypothetical protein DCF26_17210 [Burkholderiales bacterium]|nr:MAG: hypothetical protein DCF26_17210 [Burkholderiales bacterium]